MAKRPLYDWLPRNSEIHNFTNIDLSERQSRVLGMGLKFRPSLKSPTAAEFDFRSKTFVAEFAFMRYSQISHRIQISIHDCTFPPAGIRPERTQNTKTNSFICVKLCEGTFQKTNRTGRTIFQDRIELSSMN